MTDRFDPDAAATPIAAARLAGGIVAPLPAALRPPALADGYRAQFALHRRLAAGGRGERAGWKIGATTKVMQDWLAIDHPCGGGVMSAVVRRGEGRFRAADHVKPMVETEIVATLGADLPARTQPYDAAAVAAAVASLHPGIELVDDRYDDFKRHGVATLIADDFFQAGAVIGPARTDWRGLDLASARGRVTIDGAHAGEGQGAAVMGHPLNALAWLANTLIGVGAQLRAGEFVFLGSVVAPQPVRAGQRVVVAFEGLGEARAVFE
ncbi:MAG: 2-keto-4-pentenoate hydratase [Alphaproteobacteria bacterium]